MVDEHTDHTDRSHESRAARTPSPVRRRSVLRASAAGLLGGAVGASGVEPAIAQSDDEEWTRLEVTKEGAPDGRAEFDVTVSGALEPADSFEDGGSDEIDGNSATGLIGPAGGTDAVRYSGEITDFSLDGPATVSRDGEEVGPGDLPGWGDDDEEWTRLEVTKEGAPDGRAEFDVTVSGALEPADSFEDGGSDEIDGNSATGLIGPAGGTDAVRYSGEITGFSLDGPAVVYLNGDEVDPADLGPGDDEGQGAEDDGAQVEPVTPVDGEVTVALDADLLFEVAAREFAGDYVTTEWSVDGDQRFAEGSFHDEYRYGRHMNFIETQFDSTGTHDVSVTVYEGGGERELGTAAWTVHVEDGSAASPRIDRVSPEDETVETGDEESVEFSLAVDDPDGDLHRVIWWTGMCDDLLKVADVEGSADESTLTYDGTEECPIFAWAVDERGQRSWSDSWQLVESQSDETTPGPSPVYAVDGRALAASPTRAVFSMRIAPEPDALDEYETDTVSGLQLYANGDGVRIARMTPLPGDDGALLSAAGSITLGTAPILGGETAAATTISLFTESVELASEIRQYNTEQAGGTRSAVFGGAGSSAFLSDTVRYLVELESVDGPIGGGDDVQPSDWDDAVTVSYSAEPAQPSSAVESGRQTYTPSLDGDLFTADQPFAEHCEGDS